MCTLRIAAPQSPPRLSIVSSGHRVQSCSRIAASFATYVSLCVTPSGTGKITFGPLRKRSVRELEARHTLGGDVAEQQADPEQQNQSRRAHLHAAHDQRAAPFAAGAQAPGQIFRGHRDHGDGRNRDRGAEPHHEGRGDAGPEHSLRQCEHQNQDRARTGPDADGENRAEPAPPAAGTGEFAWSRAMRMTAMFVMDVIMIVIVPVVIVTMLMVAMRYVGVRMGMAVAIMVVSMTGMIVVPS